MGYVGFCFSLLANCWAKLGRRQEIFVVARVAEFVPVCCGFRCKAKFGMWHEWCCCTDMMCVIGWRWIKNEVWLKLELRNEFFYHREKRWHMGSMEKTIRRSCNLPAKAQEEGCHFGRGHKLIQMRWRINNRKSATHLWHARTCEWYMARFVIN